MAELIARLLKIFLRETPSLLLRRPGVITQMKGGEQHRRNNLFSSALFFEILIYLATPLGEFRGRMRYREPAVGQTRDAAQSVIVVRSCDPDRNRSLYRLGFDAQLFEAIVFALEGKRSLGPQPPQQLNRFIQPACPLVIGHAAPFELALGKWILMRRAHS